ncbi:MAG: ABC-F family ATP-binding cassette domain-containing protein [bacterium]
MADKSLIEVRDISKSYGEKHLFKDASVNIVERQKIGVIGRNGAGKTTFFKMILDQIEPDYGQILKMPHLRLGYIEQNDPFLPDETVIDFLERYTGKPNWECAKVASQFQLKNEKLEGKVSALSGGYQMRVKLTATLLFEPNLLLLDEPTNYLDLTTLILLENFLKSFRGAFMVITHDREFIKKTCTSTLDVDAGQLFLHPEPLEDYLEFKEEQKALAASVNVNIERKQKQLQTFVDRFGAKASMAKSAQSKKKQIAKLDDKKISINHAFAAVKMHIPSVEGKQGNALELKNLVIGYPEKRVATGINFDIERGSKVAILGDNGQGKSTLLKTIAGELTPLEGSVTWKSNLKLAYYNQHVSAGMNLEDTIYSYAKSMADRSCKDDQILQVLGNFLFKRTDHTKLIKVLSGGEKARLCLAGMFLSKADVYLLDEPTNHLDFETVEAMGEALGKFNGSVFVVSHNRTFVNLIATQIIEVKAGTVKRVLGSYEQYVWQLEQELAKESDQPQSAFETEEQSTKSISTNKARNIRLYELRKELNKVEKKMNSLNDLITSGVDVEQNKALLEDKEVTWLEITTEIEGLG